MPRRGEGCQPPAGDKRPNVFVRSGQPGQITLVYDGVEHITIQPDGKGHFTGTEVGTFSFDYLDQNGNPDNDVDASGRFTEWDGGNGFFDQNGNPIGKAEMTFTLNESGRMLTPELPSSSTTTATS